MFTIVASVEHLDELVDEEMYTALYRVARAWIEAGDRGRVGCGRFFGTVQRLMKSD